MSVAAAAVVVAAYLLGTFPTAHLVGRRQGFDPTASGSRNPGASNVTRIGGARAGVLVLLGDAGKGALAAGLGLAVDGRFLAWVAGAAAVAGHLWPITRRLRGGKGVATAAGAVLVCAPVVFLPLAVVFAVLVKATGHAAVGSIALAALLAPAVAAVGRPWEEVAVAAAIGLVVIVRHHENIGRLRRGEEASVGEDVG
ncbi:MAG TPA: glycerol-3-phosphate acyltransferase [Acidimicrobiales bacterium]|nr:glycerol-3-phosphate acyltransferase [Acidimicrobiales bacterium]